MGVVDYRRMPKVFVSYRRELTLDIAGRIYDRLIKDLGEQSVFIDVDSIPYGVDFRTYLSDWVSQCDVFLVIVGPGWADISYNEGPKTGQRRLGDPTDFLTIELLAALARDIPVIPILVGQASMPAPEDLPESVSAIAYRHAAEVRSGRSFHADMDRLIRDLRSRSLTAGDDGRPRFLSVESPAVARPINLGFESSTDDGVPTGWFNSYGFVSGVSTDYEVKVVPRGESQGKCVRIRRTNAGRREFGSLMQRCPARDWIRRTIRLEAELRTAALDDRAGIWLRIDDSANHHLYFNNMHDRPIRGTTPWTRYAIETFVPQASQWINYGVLVVGNGTVWVDDCQVYVPPSEPGDRV